MKAKGRSSRNPLARAFSFVDSISRLDLEAAQAILQRDSKVIHQEYIYGMDGLNRPPTQALSLFNICAYESRIDQLLLLLELGYGVKHKDKRDAGALD